MLRCYSTLALVTGVNPRHITSSALTYTHLFLTVDVLVRSQAMADAALTSKGQITIPADIRKAMGLKTKDRVVFTVLPDGTTVMRAKTKSIADLKGVLKNTGKRVPISEMRHI